MKTAPSLSFLIMLAACSQPNNAVSGAASSEASRTFSMVCTSAANRLQIVADDGAFTVKATSGSTVVFEHQGQRPSLNARSEDGTSDMVAEYVDFNDKGQETVPVDGPRTLEIDLGPGPTVMTYAVASTRVSLTCHFSPSRLLTFLGIAPKESVVFAGTKAVAFDIDDTLLFTTPAFTRGFATGGFPGPSDVLFWTHTNGCDAGCAEATITLGDGTTKTLPANVASTPKAKAIELVAYHKALGHEVYAITARPDINGDPLRDYMATSMGIERDHVFFEPDLDQPGNPKGKTDRIEGLDLDVFYGDSDSDITDAMKAFVDASGTRSKTVQGVRFLRSPKSSNRKSGKLNKYHPGYFGEAILSGSY